MDRQKECNHNNGKIILRSRSSQQANVKGSFFLVAPTMIVLLREK